MASVVAFAAASDAPFLISLVVAFVGALVDDLLSWSACLLVWCLVKCVGLLGRSIYGLFFGLTDGVLLGCGCVSWWCGCVLVTVVLQRGWRVAVCVWLHFYELNTNARKAARAPVKQKASKGGKTTKSACPRPPLHQSNKRLTVNHT